MSEEQNGPGYDPRSDDKLSPADKLRRKLDESKERESSLFQRFLEHSEDYVAELRMTPDDVKRLERMQKISGIMYPTAEDYFSAAIVRVMVEDREFAILAKTVNCHDYGEFSAKEGWKLLLEAISSDSDLNESTGKGTTLINVIPEEWHRKLLVQLRSDQGGETPEEFNDLKPEDIIGPEDNR